MTTLRKRRLHQPTEAEDGSAPLNLASIATINYSSEDPAHPVEHLVDEHGAMRQADAEVRALGVPWQVWARCAPSRGQNRRPASS